MTQPMSDAPPVLVVGGTGDLGGRVVRELLARHKRVRALVRPGSDASALEKQGVEIVRGDMLDPASLDPAMRGVGAVVTSAIGYSHRKKGDSLKTDFEGNRNLVDAAKRTGVPRFVLTSILQCHLARDVPHFWAKKDAEDYLETQGVPFVALRPGAYLGGGSGGFLARGLRKGNLMRMTPPGVRITFIHPDEVARALAMAVDEPRALNRRIDLGSDRALSTEELAQLFARVLGRPVKPGGKFMLRMFPLIALVVRRMRDFAAMFAFFATGQYVADTRVQAELFGPVPRVEDAARKLVSEAGL
jgi:uncharacterized protein YbjT (DUF2867 family)